MPSYEVLRTICRYLLLFFQVIQEDYRAPSEEFNSSQVLSDSPPWDYNKSVSFCGDATEKQSQLLNKKHSFVAPSPPKQRKKKSHKLWYVYLKSNEYTDVKASFRFLWPLGFH